MSKRLVTLGALGLALLSVGLAPGAGSAQEPPPKVRGDRSSLWQLLSLRGSRVNISYTPGSLARATRAQEQFEGLAQQLASWSKSNQPLAVQVLSREEWEMVGLTLPYGFPARLPGRVLAIAAHGDQGTVDLWRGLLDGPLPEVETSPLERDPQHAASLAVSDVLAQIEGVRVLLEKAGIYGQELWITELLAHTAARSVWLQRSPESLALMAGMERAWRPAGRLELSDYRAGIGMSEWLAFQAAFQAGAGVLGDGAGARAGGKLLRLARRNDGRLGARALFDRFPALAVWHRSAFGGAE